jgi:hypothetical protein
MYAVQLVWECGVIAKSIFAQTYGRHDLIQELTPAVTRAAQKMSRTYFVRLSKGGVIQTCDLKNIAWVKVLENLESIARKSAGDERAKYAYTIAVNAIRDEFRYISTGGDGAESLSHNGTLSRGKDTSYDGGSNLFGGGEDVAPTVVQPAEECWAPPTIWDAWPRLDLERRYKLLEMAGLRGATVLQRDGVRRSCAAAKWNEIPYDYQIEIESAWKQTARGELRKNKHANGAKPRNAFGFASTALPHPDELAAITPPRLRAVSLLVHTAGFITEGDGDSINSGEIAKILGRSERTMHRDNTELLKLWGVYTRASIDEKRDEKLFPRYPLNSDIAREFESMPDGAQMPYGSSPVLEGAMMKPGRLRSLRARMKKFHTDFSDAVVTATIVTPRANIYACGPDKVFKIIAGFEDSIAVSDGHCRTMDAQWDYREKAWRSVHSFSEKMKQPLPLEWLHDWSASSASEDFGEKPTKRSYGSVRDGNWTQTKQFGPLFLTTQRAMSNPMFPREAEDRPAAWCNCKLCQTMRRLDSLEGDYHDAELRMAWGSLKPYSTIEDHPLRRNARRVGIMHGFDTVVGEARIRRTHFISVADGVELWTVEDFGHAREVYTGQTGNFLTFPVFNPESVRLFLPAVPAPMRPWLPDVGSPPAWGNAPWLVDNVQAKLLLDGTLTTRAAHRGNPWHEVILVEYMSAEEIANVWYKKHRYWMDRIKAVRASEAHSEEIRADFVGSIFELWETGSVKLVLEEAKILTTSETECSAFELLIKT